MKGADHSRCRELSSVFSTFQRVSGSKDFDVLFDQRDVWKAAFQPEGDSGQQALRVLVIVADHHAGQQSGRVAVIEADLSGRDIKSLMNPGQDGFQMAAFLLQGAAAGQVEFEGQGGDVHRDSV